MQILKVSKLSKLKFTNRDIVTSKITIKRRMHGDMIRYIDTHIVFLQYKIEYFAILLFCYSSGRFK